jgi:hypothetical protein
MGVTYLSWETIDQEALGPTLHHCSARQTDNHLQR